MTELTTKIGAYNATTKTVPVTFTSGDVIHNRDVNAVLKANGSYDKTATAARVASVGNGVAAKIAVGAIVTPPVAPEPETVAVAQEATAPGAEADAPAA